MRYELQVNAEAKERFEEAVKAAADDDFEPWDERRRLAKARAAVFDQITQGVTHDYQALKAQIDALKSEIKALSPRLNQPPANPNDQPTPLPRSIRALPNNPGELKQLLAQAHVEAQLAKKNANKHQKHARQYRELYETATKYTLELEQQLKENGIKIGFRD